VSLLEEKPTVIPLQLQSRGIKAVAR